MSDKNKWVVFPEGTAGLYKVDLKNGKSAMVLRTEVSEGGGKVRDEAVSFGFEAVPDHGNSYTSPLRRMMISILKSWLAS